MSRRYLPTILALPIRARSRSLPCMTSALHWTVSRGFTRWRRGGGWPREIFGNFAPLNHGGPFGNARVGDAELSPATVRRGKFTFCLHQYAHLRGLVFPSSAAHMMRNRAMIGLITLASVILVAVSLMAGVWLGGVLFCRALSILACGQLDT
jgi:hypothetical protein